MERLLNATLVLALVALVASPAQAQSGTWTYIETRRCTTIHRNGQVHRACRVERHTEEPSWLTDRGDVIPPALRRDDIPSPEVGTPRHPRASKPSITLPRRDAPPAITLPRRDGPPAMPLPRRQITPPLAKLPAPTVNAPRRPFAAPKGKAARLAKPRVAVATLTQLEAQAFSLLNAERKRRGKSALRVDPRATVVARAHSKDMCVRGFFDHRSPEGLAPWDRLRAGKVRFSGAGENIAVGYTTAAGVHRGWMKSPGHRQNRMNGSYTRIGIGVYDCDGKPYWTEVFMK